MQTDGFTLDGVGPDQPQGDNFFPGGGEGSNQQTFTGMSLLDPSHPGQNGKSFYTIQRVNGNGGNGKGDGVPGPHKHDLGESDRVKKNSVQRMMMKNEKEAKKQQVRNPTLFSMNNHPLSPHHRSQLIVDHRKHTTRRLAVLHLQLSRSTLRIMS